MGLGLADDNSILNYFQKILVVAREGNGLVLARSNEDISIRGENDILSGNFGNDRVFGSGGNDFLIDVANETSTERIAVLTPKDAIYPYFLDNLVIRESDFDNTNGNDLLSRSENTDRSINNQPIGFDEFVELPEIDIDGNSYLVETYRYLNGEAGDDFLVGEAGDDFLDGGTGDDFLIGGAGNDVFEFFNILDDGVTTISDFSTTDDELVFYIYDNNLVSGQVSSDMLTLGTAATTDQHRFIYDDSNGNLFYDRDGIGGNEQIQLAQLGSNLSFEALLSTMSVV
ncbi:MAG: hypothetical protein AB4368_06350 [Xenococcaceae cyanobacterium]